MNRKARRAGRAKVLRKLNLVMPDPSVRSIEAWVNSLSEEQLDLIAGFTMSDDPDDNSVLVLVILHINGGTMHGPGLEEEISRQTHEAARLINRNRLSMRIIEEAMVEGGIDVEKFVEGCRRRGFVGFDEEPAYKALTQVYG